jgi:hypothetical protein
MELLIGWIDESWRAVAPKRLVKARLDGAVPGASERGAATAAKRKAPAAAKRKAPATAKRKVATVSKRKAGKKTGKRRPRATS